MKEGLPVLYVGLDLSRKRLDWLALDLQQPPAAPLAQSQAAIRPHASSWSSVRHHPESSAQPLGGLIHEYSLAV
jgi:hypothetical protein